MAKTVTRLTRSLGNPGHKPVVIFPAPLGRERSTRKMPSLKAQLDIHALEHGRHDLDIGLANAGNLDLTAGNARHDRPTPSLDVVAPETVFGAVELRATLDTDRRCARAGDADANLLEEFAQLHDVRLACRVANLGDPDGRRSRENRGFSSCHRRFEQIERRWLQTFGRFQVVCAAGNDLRAHRSKRFQMRGQGSAGWEVAAGRRQQRPTPASEQRSDQQHGTTQPADQQGVWLVFDDLTAAHAKGARPDALDFGSEINEQPRHHINVADQWHVCQNTRLGRQQTRGQQRQRGILVALYLDSAAQPLAAFNA